MSNLVIRASSVPSRSIRWAWQGRLAVAYLTVMTGNEGLGKSVFAAWLMARLTHGDLPGEWRAQTVDVLIVAGEDGIGDTWKPRLDLADADLDRVAFLNLTELPPDWNLRDGVEQSAEAIVESGAQLVYIDAALDHMPPPKGGESVNSPTFVRQALSPLRRLARERSLAVAFTMHPPKQRGASFRDVVQASQAFSAIPRVGLLLDWHPDDLELPEEERRRVLIRGKGNLGRNPGALSFRVIGRTYLHDDGRETEREVVVDVQPCDLTLADLNPDRVVGTNREPTKTERATKLLRTVLADGKWHLADDVHALLDEQGIGSASVLAEAHRKAKDANESDAVSRMAPGSGRSSAGTEPWSLRSSRARSLPARGAFPSEGQNRSDNGKAPRLCGPQPSERPDRRLHAAAEHRARGGEPASGQVLSGHPVASRKAR